MSFNDVINIISFSISVASVYSFCALFYKLLRAWAPSYTHEKLEKILQEIANLLDQNIEDGFQDDLFNCRFAM